MRRKMEGKSKRFWDAVRKIRKEVDAWPEEKKRRFCELQPESRKVARKAKKVVRKKK